MGPRSLHSAQEGDAFGLLEMNALVGKVQINPRTAKDLVKMLEETGTKVPHQAPEHRSCKTGKY
jgi:hypothetical protein